MDRLRSPRSDAVTGIIMPASADASDGGSADEEVSLELDENGRPAGVSRSARLSSLAFATFTHSEPGTLAVLEDDCASCFDGETSFWLPAGTAPRCGLEQLAAEIFELHSAGSSYDAARSGAEWWVQVREDGESRGLNMHADKDEDLVDQCGVNVHPEVSTVTYICAGGYPTLVLDARVGLAYESGYAQRVERAWASFPEVGKHIVFDGRLLHAVGPIGGCRGRSGRRITFLVNVWLNHVPLNLEQFPCPEKLGVRCSATALWSGAASEAAQLVTRGDGETEEWPVRTGAPHTVVLEIPARLGEVAAEAGASVEVQFRRGSSCAIASAPELSA